MVLSLQSHRLQLLEANLNRSIKSARSVKCEEDEDLQNRGLSSSSFASFSSIGEDAKEEEKLELDAKLRIGAARRQMALEVLFLVSELLTEFYSTAAATLCGIILRKSSVVTLLRNDMPWSRLPLFLLVQFGPELVGAWFVIVYLRYLGVDWRDLIKSSFGKPHVLILKVVGLLTVVLLFFFTAIG